MKKYPFIVIPIIILLIIGIAFVWIYPNKTNNISSPMNEVINQISEINNESMSNIVDENIMSSENVIKDNEVIEEKVAETVDNKVEETTTKKAETSAISTNKTTSSTKNTTSTKNVIKEEKNNETKSEEKSTQSTTKNTTSKTENKSNDTEEKTVVRCTNNDNHGMGVGNTKKWFSTKAEAIAYYDSEVKRWGDWWEGTDADDTDADATYYKNCPTGYEIWNCMYCSKWTINFYYR